MWIPLRNCCTIFLLLLTWACQAPQKETKTQEEGKSYFYWAVDWHPNKEQIVVGGTNDSLKIFSSKDLSLIHDYPYLGTITKTKWHPSKNKLAVSVQDGLSQTKIIYFDTEKNITLDSVSNEGARAIGWNHTGELLAVGDYEGMISIYSEDGTFLHRIDTGQKSIIGLDWHPTKNMIAGIGEKIILYDYNSDSIKSIEDRDKEVLMLCVDWHPNGEFFVTGDYGDFIEHHPPLLQYWTAEGERIKAIEGSKAEYRNLEWSKDGELLATASEKLRLWDQEGNLVADQKTSHLLWGIDWNKAADTLVTTDEEGKVVFWDRKLKRLNEIRH